MASLILTGTATSQGVPVIGCTCAACTSTDPRDRRSRTSAVIEHGERRWSIDAGPDFRNQMLAIGARRLDGIVVTHEHNDHTAGLDDVRPFCFMQQMDMPVYCLARVAKEIKERFSYAFSNYPGVPKLALKEASFGDRLELEGLNLRLLKVNHGKLPIFGVRVNDLAYLTDTKTLPPETLDRLQGLDTLVLSCLNYRGTHSHLSVEEALRYVELLQPRRTVLFHLSHRLGTHAEFQSTLPAGVEVGYDGMRLPL